MSDLTGRTQNDTYKDLLHIENNNLGLDGTLRQTESGNGIGSALAIGTLGIGITGTLAVSGVASLDVTPNVNGDTMWHAGNDGPGSGLDADTLQGNLPSAFLLASSSANISGVWSFLTALTFSRSNDSELTRWNDTSNNTQMQARFDSNLDFALIPGTATVFDATKQFRYDSSAERWSFDTGLNISQGGTELFKTQDLGATKSSGGQIIDGLGNFRDIGFNVMAPVDFSGSEDFDIENLGGRLNYTGVGGGSASVLNPANIPDGGAWTISNTGTGTCSISTTGITLTFLDGSGTLVTGARTLAIAGIATITKRTGTTFEIWGAGLT